MVGIVRRPVGSGFGTTLASAPCRAVANRILSVGEAARARLIASHCFDGGRWNEVGSSRGFRVFTGLFEGVPVSIIATGMGTPMMDFVVRESRAIVDGDMAIIRLGSCGGLLEAPTGSFVVASEGAVLVRREPDALHHGADAGNDHGASPDRPYSISRPVLPDRELTTRLSSCLREAVGEAGEEAPVIGGLNATTDSYFSSQGRSSEHFDDRNEGIIEYLEALYPSARSFEMEHFHLLELAAASRGCIKASAVAIPKMNRTTQQWTPDELFHRLEIVGGRGVLRTLVRTPLDGAMATEDIQVE